MGGSRWTEADRDAALKQLAAARERGDAWTEVATLVDLVAIYRALQDPWSLIDCAHRAWQAAERNCFWDQLARLALIFGDVTYSAREYQQCYDHYANACAYAVMADDGGLPAVLARLDEVLDEMVATGRASVAEAFCELLVAYEAEGGLGRPDPDFAARFRERQEQARASVRSELARAIRLN